MIDINTLFYTLINVCCIRKDKHEAYCRLGQTLIANYKHLCYGTLNVNFMFLHFKNAQCDNMQILNTKTTS